MIVYRFSLVLFTLEKKNKSRQKKNTIKSEYNERKEVLSFTAQFQIYHLISLSLQICQLSVSRS